MDAQTHTMSDAATREEVRGDPMHLSESECDKILDGKIQQKHHLFPPE